MRGNKGVARGGPKGLGTTQSKCYFALPRTNNEQISVFMLHFSWNVSKMQYIRNKFSKIFQRWGLSAPNAT